MKQFIACFMLLVTHYVNAQEISIEQLKPRKLFIDSAFKILAKRKSKPDVIVFEHFINSRLCLKLAKPRIDIENIKENYSIIYFKDKDSIGIIKIDSLSMKSFIRPLAWGSYATPIFEFYEHNKDSIINQTLETGIFIRNGKRTKVKALYPDIYTIRYYKDASNLVFVKSYDVMSFSPMDNASEHIFYNMGLELGQWIFLLERYSKLVSQGYFKYN